MMNQWYQIKVKYTKEFTDGTLKRITEPYLLNAMSFTDAEAGIYRNVGEYVRGEFLVVAMSRFEVADMFFYDDADTWYVCKVQMIVSDADTGRERKETKTYLLTAQTTAEANDRLIQSLTGLLVTYRITSVKETDIVEVFPFEPITDEEE